MQLHEVLWPNKYLLIVAGLWPMRCHAKRSRRFTVYLLIILAMITQITLLVPHLIAVVLNWGDLEILGDCGARTVIYILVIMKMWYYVYRQGYYRSMYQHVKDFWEMSDDPKERTNYEQFAIIAKLVTIVSIVSGIGDFIGFEAVALATWTSKRCNDSLHHRSLPFDISYGFDTQSTPNYAVMFIWQSICMIYTFFTVVGGDCTMMVFIFHVAGQFKLINFRFRAIGRKIDEKTTLKDAYEELHAEIGECIAHHQRIIQVTEKLDALLSPLFFSQIMTSGLEISLSGYAMIEGHTGTADFIKYFVFFISMLVQLVVWCWPAEILIKESGQIAKTIYHDIPWFKLTPKQRRDLNIVVIGAQKESHVTVLHQVMSISKLTEIFNAAFAYVTLLRSMKNK